MSFYLLISLITFWLAGTSEHQVYKPLELELLIEAEPAILFNHVNPVQFILSSSYGDVIVEATGQLYQDDLELYWQTLEPVVWTLEVPESGALEVNITARLALCDKQQGLCYFEDIDLQETLSITASENKKTLTLALVRPSY